MSRGKNSKKNRRKSRGTGFIVLGLLFIMAALGLSAYNYWDGSRAEKASMEIVADLQVLLDEEAAERDSDGDGIDESGAVIDNPYADLPGMEDPYRQMETMEIKGYNYIGILEIPSLGLTLPVMEDWDYSRLKISPCRFYGSYYNNDLVIAGHNYARHFSPVKWVKLGSDVYFTNAEGVVYHYQVDYIETLRPEQVDDMITGDWDLTLFTCNRGGSTRCTVRCSRVY